MADGYPGPWVEGGEGVRIVCNDRLATRSSGSPTTLPRRRSRARTPVRYIRAPLREGRRLHVGLVRGLRVNPAMRRAHKRDTA